MVAGVDFHDAACSTRELALPVGRVPRSCAQTRYVDGTSCQAADCTGCPTTARLCRAVLSRPVAESPDRNPAGTSRSETPAGR